jgi:hypothetical protein
MNSEINLNKITTDLQQNNNWNVMTLENVLNNNKKHPVNTAVFFISSSFFLMNDKKNQYLNNQLLFNK